MIYYWETTVKWYNKSMAQKHSVLCMHITLALFINFFCTLYHLQIETDVPLYGVNCLVASFMLFFYHKNLSAFGPCFRGLATSCAVCLVQVIFHALYQEDQTKLVSGNTVPGSRTAKHLPQTQGNPKCFPNAQLNGTSPEQKR